jgi:hypothetical protein
VSAHPHEPFDAEEAAIARAYRALPGGEPSPALDARILAHARAANTTRKPRRRPWLFGAGFGAAAAAVMAAGIAWQIGLLDGQFGISTVPSRAPEAAVTGADAEAEVDRIDIEFMRQERRDAALEEPAAPPPMDAPAAAPAPPPALPPPPPAPAVQREQAEEILAEQRLRKPVEAVPEAQMAPQPFPAENAAADTLGAAAGARSADQPDQAATAPASPAATRGAAAKQEATLPPWAEDATLAPDAWLERIRERVHVGDRQGAEHSLRRFVLRHPNRAVPRELQRLLVE